MRRDKQLAGHVKEKCQVLDKVSQLQKENEILETALKVAHLKEEAREAQRWEAAYKKMSRDRAKIRGCLPFLLKELKDDQSDRFPQQQPEMVRDIQQVCNTEQIRRSTYSSWLYKTIQ